MTFVGMYKPQQQAIDTKRYKILEIFFRIRYRNPEGRNRKSWDFCFSKFTCNCFCEDGTCSTDLTTRALSAASDRNRDH